MTNLYTRIDKSNPNKVKDRLSLQPNDLSEANLPFERPHPIDCKISAQSNFHI